MNELDLAVLRRASTNGLHSVSMLLDANDAITVTVTSPTPKTTMKSIIRIGSNAAECSFSFSEKELKHGGKVELTAHTFNCETITDIVLILDEFRTHLRAAYIDHAALKMHLSTNKEKATINTSTVPELGATPAAISDVYAQVVGRVKASDPVPPSPPAYVWDAPQATAKKEDDLPFNTDLDEEDKT